jgi:recombinational DNA repair protein (RecF pathway)
MLEEHWFLKLDRESRQRAGRMSGLLLRLVHGEVNDPRLFTLFVQFLTLLPDLSEESRDTLEVETALRMLALLGLDAGPLPDIDTYEPLQEGERRALVTRINRGILASGL